MSIKDFTNHVTTSLLACVVAMMAFWMVEARYYITREECEAIMAHHSPYARDKALIMSEIQSANERHKDLHATVKETSAVLNQLNIEIAVLNKTLQTMQTVQAIDSKTK